MFFKHQFNVKEQRIGHRHFPVDGVQRQKLFINFTGVFLRLPVPRGAHQYRQREVDVGSSVSDQKQYRISKTLRDGCRNVGI